MVPTLWGLVPLLRIVDARRSRDFYCGRLGFRQEWEQSFEHDFPPYVSLSRDGCRIYLTEEPGAVPGVLVDLYTDDIDALCRDFEDRGADVTFGPADEIRLVDPDGNRLRFRPGSVKTV